MPTSIQSSMPARVAAGAIRVIIVKPGVYSDSFLRAGWREEGDILETRPWYAEEMIERGDAEALPVSLAALLPKEPEEGLGTLEVSNNVKKILAALGYSTYARLRELSDEQLDDLVKVPGIGPASLASLKEWVNASPDG